jgi:DNA-binding transcriptional ArsR family regulator
MDAVPRLATATALFAEPAGARMLNALMDGGLMTATELSLHAWVTPQAASSHLASLDEAGLVALEKRGRSHYYRLGGAAVAEAMEALQVLAADTVQPGGRATLHDEQFRIARTCYDHLAGRLGVAITESLVQRRYLEPRGGDFCVKPAGARLLLRLGVNVQDAKAKHRRSHASAWTGVRNARIWPAAQSRACVALLRSGLDSTNTREPGRRRHEPGPGCASRYLFTHAG